LRAHGFAAAALGDDRCGDPAAVAAQVGVATTADSSSKVTKRGVARL
jgi:hypothetical protein